MVPKPLPYFFPSLGATLTGFIRAFTSLWIQLLRAFLLSPGRVPPSTWFPKWLFLWLHYRPSVNLKVFLISIQLRLRLGKLAMSSQQFPSKRPPCFLTWFPASARGLVSLHHTIPNRCFICRPSSIESTLQPDQFSLQNQLCLILLL